jgi:hypothetical protein
MKRLLGLVLAGTLWMGRASAADVEMMVNPSWGESGVSGWNHGYSQWPYASGMYAPTSDSLGYAGHIPPPYHTMGFYGYNPGSSSNAGYAGFVSAATYSTGGYPGAPSSWYGAYDYGYAPDYGYVRRSCGCW